MVLARSMELWFEAVALRMEVSESIVCLKLHFGCQVSGPLVQESLPRKPDLENCYSFNVAFNRTGRVTGLRVNLSAKRQHENALLPAEVTCSYECEESRVDDHRNHRGSRRSSVEDRIK